MAAVDSHRRSAHGGASAGPASRARARAEAFADRWAISSGSAHRHAGPRAAGYDLSGCRRSAAFARTRDGGPFVVRFASKIRNLQVANENNFHRHSQKRFLVFCKNNHTESHTQNHTHRIKRIVATRFIYPPHTKEGRERGREQEVSLMSCPINLSSKLKTK